MSGEGFAWFAHQRLIWGDISACGIDCQYCLGDWRRLQKKVRKSL